MTVDAQPYWLREITEYQRLFAEPTDAERLTKLFWSISDFPSDLLFEKLQEVSGADFDDDYSEFLRKNNLLKAGLAISDSYAGTITLSSAGAGALCKDAQIRRPRENFALQIQAPPW